MINIKYKDYRIKSDTADSMTLTKIRRNEADEIVLDKEGKEVQVLVGYYPRMELVLKAMRDDSLATGVKQITTIVEYLKEFRALNNEYKELFDKLEESK